jgi:hypothetical protein
MIRKNFELLGLVALFPLTIATNTNEIVYLANCGNCTSEEACQYDYSTMAYYSEQANFVNYELSGCHRLLHLGRHLGGQRDDGGIP